MLLKPKESYLSKEEQNLPKAIAHPQSSARRVQIRPLLPAGAGLGMRANPRTSPIATKACRRYATACHPPTAAQPQCGAIL
ncbi:hypothetical protein I41_07090 [Lacipirellula limnantheis]|uniref:Uncharacterized protein n=1 Tax=Lacipirellula limnantheis TaxID=2528024 RepID=A0A517TT52_9BACT|nr:hypothetical protein I41_07090 [Lacipirellula limnantheis]